MLRKNSTSITAFTIPIPGGWRRLFHLVLSGQGRLRIKAGGQSAVSCHRRSGVYQLRNRSRPRLTLHRQLTRHRTVQPARCSREAEGVLLRKVRSFPVGLAIRIRPPAHDTCWGSGEEKVFYERRTCRIQTRRSPELVRCLNFKHFAQNAKKLRVNASIAPCLARSTSSQGAANWF